MVRAGPDEKVLTVKLKALLFERLMEKSQIAGFQPTSELLRHLIRQYAAGDDNR
jgi:hypothetical protein